MIEAKGKTGRPPQWAPIPSWHPYEMHPDSRVRNGKYVLRQFARDGITYVRLHKDLITHRQLFIVPVKRLMVWTFGARCIVCHPKRHNPGRHRAILKSVTRGRPEPGDRMPDDRPNPIPLIGKQRIELFH